MPMSSGWSYRHLLELYWGGCDKHDGTPHPYQQMEPCLGESNGIRSDQLLK